MDAVQPPQNPRQIQIARDAWRMLSRRDRRDVLRHARDGERHPNLRVASTAYRWASTVIPPGETGADRVRRYGTAGVLGIIFDLAVGALFGGTSSAAGGAIGVVAANRRMARKILDLGPPPAV
ncbi:MAG TPA: hypothetical protein VFH54_16780 [Mycobacteriales bacterium]|nr:hypothetical protein [Mycobacteriales bacterium]